MGVFNDRFMGASNTLVTGMKYGLNVFGQDINPLSLLISQVKTSYYSLFELESAEESLKARVNSDTSGSSEIYFHNIDNGSKRKFNLSFQNFTSLFVRNLS